MCCSICTFVLPSDSRDCRNLNEFALEEYSVCTCMQQQNASDGKCFQFYRDCWTPTAGDHKDAMVWRDTNPGKFRACVKIRPLVANTFPIRRMIFMILSRWLAARVVLIAFLCSSPWRSQQTYSQQTPNPRPIAVADLFAIRNLHDPQITPDGRWVAYSVGSVNREADKNEERIWMVPAAGGEAIALTSEDVSSSHPRWSPDGKYLAFLSARNDGKTQIWLLNRQGGEAQKLTNPPQDVDDFDWAPDAKRLVVVLRDPKPEELEEAKNKDKDRDKDGADKDKKT